MDPLEAGKLLVLLAALAGIYLKINKALREMAGKGELREISPNPLNILQQYRAASMEDVEAVEKRVNRLEQHVLRVERNQDDIEAKIDELRDRVDDKLTDLKDIMAEKHGETMRAIGRLEGN